MAERLSDGLAALILAAALVFGGVWGASAQGNYLIRPGDTLNIEVLEDPDLNRRVLVLPDGTISFPLVGSVSTQGRTVAALENALSTGLASNFAVEPNVFVSVNELAEVPPPPVRTPVKPLDPVTLDTYVVGEVANPGKFDVEPGTTILQLLAQAGGPTKFAAVRRIELRRTDYLTGAIKTYLFSYTRRAKGPRISGGTILSPGDVVVVPQRRFFE